MASYQGRTLHSPFATIIEQNTFDKFQDDWSDRLQLAEVFHLIDSFLPFEVCVYHEVLPLSIEQSLEQSAPSGELISGEQASGEQTEPQPNPLPPDTKILHLGMVTPDDEAALDYIQRLASYQHYHLIPHRITSEALQTVLSNYLKDAGSHQLARHRATEQSPTTAPTTSPTTSPTAPPTASPDSLTLIEPDEDLDLDTPAPNTLDLADLIAPPTCDIAIPSFAPTLLELELEPSESLPTELAQFPPESILRHLLSQILQGGIGRLYFECHAQHGRILWSKDGVVQAALDHLELSVFQGIIDALKQLAQLPVSPVRQVLQPEVEYAYQKTRLMLRFRFVQSEFGEEATVQILRGVALKFYQKQQLAQLERDAVTLARRLQQTVNELRDRTLHHPSSLDAIPEISRVLRAIDSQISELS
jgi:hypothetical protein